MSSRPASLPDDVWKCVTDKARRETLAALDVMNTHADDDFARLNRLAADALRCALGCDRGGR